MELRKIEEVVKEIERHAEYRNCDPTYLFENYDIENALDEILEIHKAEQEPYKVCDQVTWECNILIDEIRKQLIEEKNFAYADFDEYKYEVLGVDDVDDLPDDDFRYGLERAIEIIDKYKGR